jgi:hypothetical protein
MFGENGVPIRASSPSTKTPTPPQRLGQAVVSGHGGCLRSSYPASSSAISGFNRRLIGSSAQQGGNISRTVADRDRTVSRHPHSHSSSGKIVDRQTLFWARTSNRLGRCKTDFPKENWVRSAKIRPPHFFRPREINAQTARSRHAIARASYLSNFAVSGKARRMASARRSGPGAGMYLLAPATLVK